MGYTWTSRRSSGRRPQLLDDSLPPAHYMLDSSGTALDAPGVTQPGPTPPGRGYVLPETPKTPQTAIPVLSQHTGGISRRVNLTMSELSAAEVLHPSRVLGEAGTCKNPSPPTPAQSAVV